MILVFVVLLSIVLVAFIASSRLNRSSTASYSQSIRAQEIAQGGIQDILGDLHAEIVAGSVSDPAGTIFSAGTNTVYLPSTNYTAVPVRFGYLGASYGTDTTATTLPPSLIRVSRASQDGTPTDCYPPYNSAYYTNSSTATGGMPVPLNRASAAATTAYSANDRNVSIAKWNRPLLLASSTDSSVFPAPFMNAPPDWVYVTRAGSRACITTDVPSMKPSSNLAAPANNNAASPVVGRYAYVMYDEGALLDANSAGYPSSVTTTSSYVDSTTGVNLALMGKSYLGTADLTQLPGLSGAIPQVSGLVNWRNAGALNTYASASSPYLAALFNYAKAGFITFVSNAAATDSPLLGRQDVINYFAKIDANINTTSATYSKALPYLGTFSRAVNAASWFPTADALTMGGINGHNNIYAYRTNAETAGSINRDLANIRFTSAGTVLHYADSTSTTTYLASIGDPLLQRRFSLARINWLTHTGPSTSSTYPNATAAIQACFGLTWDNANSRWNYAGPTGSTALSKIETLDQVAAENPLREPNFFELLKAGILSGSLGRDPGVGNADTNNSPQNSSADFNGGPCNGVIGLWFDNTGSNPGYSANADMQVIQIGANIIDQYDTDSYPTAIHFPIAQPRTGHPEDDLANTCYGQENLPYVTTLLQIATGTGGNITGYWQPELWNPYQAPATPPANAPTKFLVRAYGQTYLNAGNIPSAVTDYTNNNPVGVNSIYVQDPNACTATSVFYIHPQPLLASYCTGTPTVAQNLWSAATSTDSDNPFAGFFVGITPSQVTTANGYSLNTWNDGNGNLAGEAVQCTNTLSPGNQLTIVMEYQDSSGNYLPYGLFSRLSSEYYDDPWTDAAPFTSWMGTSPLDEESYLIMRPDPRTDRFSAGANTYSYAPDWYDINHGKTPMSWRSSQGYDIQRAAMAYNQALNSDGSSAFTFNMSPYNGGGPNPWNYGTNWFLLGFWAMNVKSAPAVAPNDLWIDSGWATNAYYSDQDGIVRPGDSYLIDGSFTSTGDGCSLFDANQDTSTTTVRRPVILNRPFRSVGEIGYAFRDDPFKSVDFWSAASGDGGLLDLFSLYDEPTVVAGHLNPNNSPAPVLAALLSGVSQNSDTVDTQMSSADANTLATALASQMRGSPIRNRAELVTGLSNALQTTYYSMTTTSWRNKANFEAPVRSLSSTTDMRTWNLLIDIIAQSGRMTSTAQTLNDFVVEGERRYWLHIAIDRYTGKIVDQQMEPIYE